MKPNNKFSGKSKLKAHLTFNDGWKEIPIYSIKASTSEKGKGIDMIDLIENNFNISQKDIEEHRQLAKAELLREMNGLEGEVNTHIQWTRDSKGRIVSPFATKKKETN